MSEVTKTIIILLVIALIGGVIAVLYVRHYERMTIVARESLEWPSVTGLVTHSNLETRLRKTGSKKNQSQHWVEVRYEYVVDGERYENDVVRFNQHSLSRSEKARLVSDHPVGRRVEVFYDPSDPDESVLVRGSWP